MAAFSTAKQPDKVEPSPQTTPKNWHIRDEPITWNN